MKYTPLIDQLIEALRCQPGIGPKSAQRIAFELLEHRRPAAQKLARALDAATEGVRHCDRCRNFSEGALSLVCANPKRNQTQICVVESPADVLSIEQTAEYNGLYFVLMGHLSPLDGIGPEDIGLDKLTDQIDQNGINEIILATGTTVEGEATAHYINGLFDGSDKRVTRIAHGVPLGGELDLVDASTLSHAISLRREI